jgi:hypothetical protein
LLSAFLPLAGTQPAHADVLTVTATGTIGTACSIAVASPFSSPDLSASGSVGATATVNCNTGFKVNATSANGAIKTATTAPTSFTNTLPYNFTFSVPLESGSPNPISATCASTALVAGQSSCALSPANGTGLSSSGRASIGKTATLTLAYTVPTLPTRLIAGSYTDTITLTVATVP